MYIIILKNRIPILQRKSCTLKCKISTLATYEGYSFNLKFPISIKENNKNILKIKNLKIQANIYESDNLVI